MAGSWGLEELGPRGRGVTGGVRCRHEARVRVAAEARQSNMRVYAVDATFAADFEVGSSAGEVV